jgi:tripartite-type tricarboxylate transporter receptor subunit TctC
LFAPARVPPAIVERLYREAAKAVTEPEFTRRMETGGTETVGNSPREFTAQVRAEYEKWRGLVKRSGLKLE